MPIAQECPECGLSIFQMGGNPADKGFCWNCGCKITVSNRDLKIYWRGQYYALKEEYERLVQAIHTFHGEARKAKDLLDRLLEKHDNDLRLRKLKKEGDPT